MPWHTLFRTSAALRCAPVLYAWIAMYSSELTGWVTEGYWPSAAAQSAFLLNFTVPAVAACGAWEALKVRRSGVLGAAPSRSATTIALSALAPVLAMGAGAVLLALALLAPRADGLPGRSTALILATELLVVLAHAVAGYVLGSALPRMLAVPLALIGGFVWMAYPASLNTFWVRQLNGRNLSECCALDQVPSPRAVASVLLTVTGLVAAGWIRLRLRGHLRWSALPALAVAVLLGAWIAAPLGHQASTARPLSERSCTDGAPRICLWPEQRPETARITTWSVQAAERLRAAGLTPPATVTPLTVRPAEDEVRVLVATSLVPGRLPQCAHQRGARWPGAGAVAPLSVWLTLTAGATPGSVEGRYGRPAVARVSQIMTLPAADQLAWYERNMATLDRCDLEPVLEAAR
ncbi:hypothetical protein ACIA8O_16750 [Kitasatospora sp. NPDC051853]|uniref:DUF7224 domain-containing protein n=1 Tax=Kitasatospora sp. NPDC051853 TaxID=3364058 RepID=UPI0037975AAA